MIIIIHNHFGHFDLVVEIEAKSELNGPNEAFDWPFPTVISPFITTWNQSLSSLSAMKQDKLQIIVEQSDRRLSFPPTFAL